ncbi:MAG: maleylacetoacetate isomerase [Caulobacteraceae bacterium]|nr:maleylacetoacetate isomerase [Caulobacteraceae bacterium]
MAPGPITLHGYWRATAPYRVRIALALKDLAYDWAPVDLVAGEQRLDRYRDLNPLGLVPALVCDGLVLTQSLAILEWLEETHPSPPLLPEAAADRAQVRAMADVVACDIHPLNNLRVRQALADLGHDAESAEQRGWGRDWIARGFAALEAMIARHGDGFAFGAQPTLADCLIVPQIWASDRFGVTVADYPHLRALWDRAAATPAFASAHPDRFREAPPSG